jgi:hypothetical protein
MKEIDWHATTFITPLQNILLHLHALWIIVAQTGDPARPDTGLLGPTANQAMLDWSACRNRGPGTASQHVSLVVQG